MFYIKSAKGTITYCENICVALYIKIIISTWYFLVPTKSNQRSSRPELHSLNVIPHLLRDANTFTAQTIHAYKDCFGYSYYSLSRYLCCIAAPRRDYRRGKRLHDFSPSPVTA